MPKAIKQVDLFDSREFKPLRDEPVRAPAEPTEPPAWANSVAPNSAFAPKKSAPQGPMSATKPMLIVGGTGSFGTALTHELVSRGVPVRLLVRDGPKAWKRFGDDPLIKMVKGDATEGATIARAADGCDAVVHAVGTPMHRWSPMLQRSTAAVIAGAQRLNQLILYPSDTSPLGAQTGRPLSESAPLRAAGRFGAIRAEMEETLQAAVAGGKCRALVLRMGDCFGPTVRNAFVDGIFLNALRGMPMRAMGNLGAAHQWAYMPDVARVAADILLMGRSEHAFDGFEVINAPGYIVRPQRLFYETVAKVVGYSACHIRRRSWLGLSVAALANGEARAAMERRPAFDHGVLLDDAKLTRLFPRFEPTPLLNAVEETVRSYCSESPQHPGR